MQQYLKLLKEVYHAAERKDRTGVGTTGLFGYQMRFALSAGFPMMTTKRLPLKAIIHELLWFLKGDTNVKYLQDNGVTIWDEWADMDGGLGPVYGKQWRHWSTGTAAGDYVDQIAELVEGLKKNPFSRRHMVSAWNPADVPSMKLPPCHCLFQCYVREAALVERAAQHLGIHEAYLLRTSDEWAELEESLDKAGVPKMALDLQLYQRSADVFLGVPFNIASYSLLTMMLAQVVGMVPGEFIWSGGDTHLYLNHRSQALEQMARPPKQLPMMVLNPAVAEIFDFKYEDFKLVGYDPYPTIQAQVAV